MALNVNGYNDTFQSFVDFARIRDGMGKKTAIARVTTFSLGRNFSKLEHRKNARNRRHND